MTSRGFELFIYFFFAFTLNAVYKRNIWTLSSVLAKYVHTRKIVKFLRVRVRTIHNNNNNSNNMYIHVVGRRGESLRDNVGTRAIVTDVTISPLKRFCLH